MPDLDDLLNPVGEESPAGPNLRYEPVYDEIKRARHEDPDLPQGEWKRERKVADWGEVVRLATDVLANRSKDLQVAAWLTEGLLRKDGFGGLRFGLSLLHRLQNEFWDSLHPQLEEEDDLEFRAVPLEWVGQYLEPAVKSVPLNGSGHGLLEYQQSRKIGYEEDAEKDSSRKAARAEAVAAGRPTAEDFDEGFEATPKAWYKELAADLHACREELEALNRFCDEKYGNVAPSFLNLREALDEVARIADRLLERKLELDPDPPEGASDQVGEGDRGEHPSGQDAAEPSAGGAGRNPEGSGSAGVTAPAVREPSSWDEAAELAGVAAAFMRRERPTDPASYLMLRGLRWGELRVGGSGVDPRLLEAPPTQLRTRLKSLLLDGEWEELLEAAEDMMATPYGRGWLDLQRYVLTALEELGGEYEPVAASVRQAIRGLLVDLPELLEVTLMDDSPTANRETTEWLHAGILEGVDEEREQAARASASAGGRRGDGRDPLSRAMTHVRAGRPQKAIQLLLDEATREESPRARFLRRSEAAQIMVRQGMEGVAMPILREMMDQVDQHQLEEWEAGETVARAMALLYTCMDRLEEDPKARQELYLRICRLDPMQGMGLDSGEPDGVTGDVADPAAQGGGDGDAEPE